MQISNINSEIDIFGRKDIMLAQFGLNEATIKKYIQDQEKYDITQDKLSVKEYEDPFKG